LHNVGRCLYILSSVALAATNKKILDKLLADIQNSSFKNVLEKDG